MKKLTKSLLKSIEEKQFKLTEIKISIMGEAFPIEVQKEFKETSIQKMIQEVVIMSEYCNQNNLEDFNPSLYLEVLILKEHTNLPFKRIENDVEKQLKSDIDMYASLTNILTDEVDEDGIKLSIKSALFSYLKDGVKQVERLYTKYSNNIKKIEESYQQVLDMELRKKVYEELELEEE